jgi:hypothetical protein
MIGFNTGYLNKSGTGFKSGYGYVSGYRNKAG